MKPKILLSYGNKAEEYTEVIETFGGAADAKYCPDYSEEYDGLILCGGNDIDPSCYGEEINGAKNINYERDKADFKLTAAFAEAKKPILGVCRGSQLLNVFFGGSLYQHIENAAMHISYNDVYSVHGVTAVEDTLIYDLYGSDFSVNSSHHQAVKRLGEGLVVNARSGDIVEAFTHKSLPIIGVQWHPERMCCSRTNPDTVLADSLFKHFIDLCSKRG